MPLEAEANDATEVVKKHTKSASALLITLSSTSFSQEVANDGDFRKGVSSKKLFIGSEGDSEKPVTYKPKKPDTCRKIPVKETTTVISTRHVNGQKIINEYIKERKISRGSYGKVALYRNINDGTPYAIKAICKSRLRKIRVSHSETALTNVHREISIMKRLDHPNIVSLIEVINDPTSDHLYMVLEYVEGNGICNVSQITERMTEKTARRYFNDIVAGVIYLHTHNIVHGDIKPENLLLTRHGRLKIGDFSVSHMFEDENDELSIFHGTPAFTAPECCLDSVYKGKAADTWAVGVTLYYMVVGDYPFLAGNLPETFDKIVNSPLSLPKDLNPDLGDLLHSLLNKDPMQRISLADVARHPWVVKDGGSAL
ncbi:hypothetical protein ACFE04_028534 [Oxalis oulophora]